jgi:peptide/nickel transport system permease protein
MHDLHQPRDTASRVKVTTDLVSPESQRPPQRILGWTLRLNWLRGREGLGWVEHTALWAIGLLVVVLLVVPSLLPYSPTDLVDQPLLGPSWAHPLGLDDLGRDLLSRVVYGMRMSVISAVLVIASGVVIGGTIGLAAGMAGGWVDAVLMRLTDLFLALPGPLLVLAIVAALGPSLQDTLIGVAVVWWPWYARVVRGQVRATVGMPHVETARLVGLSPMRVALRHVLPNAFGPVIVTASLDVGNVILLLASLSFLGLGSPDPASELGAMTARGLTYLLTNWWVAVFPAAAVFLLTFIANFAGDGIRDVMERH